MKEEFSNSSVHSVSLGGGLLDGVAAGKGGARRIEGFRVQLVCLKLPRRPLVDVVPQMMLRHSVAHRMSTMHKLVLQA